MSDIIDINVGETIEEVTINVVDNLITVNINKVTGGGGNQDLQSVTDNGNTTTNDISLLNSSILLDNGSRLKKGTTDAGNGGNKGIALKCSLDYELKWEAGRKYIMEQDGITIREVSHNFTNIPTTTDDNTKGFIINSRWILDNGDVYVCTDATEGAAVWEFITGAVPTLQQVMETGRSYNQTIGDYTYRLEFDEADGAFISVNDNDLNTISGFQLQQGATLYFSDGISGKSTSVYSSDFGAGLGAVANTFGQNLLNIPFRTSGSGITYFQPPNNKPAGSYILAITDDIPSLTGYVPYTGATTNVDLGEFELKAGQVEFDQTPTGTAGVGVMRWNDTDGTIDLGLKGGNVTLQIGQENVIRVVNKTATNVNLLQANYQVVRVTGAQGQRLKVDLAQATNDTLSAETIGLVTETINNNEEGFITTNGLVRNINTTGSLQSETWLDGDILYLSPTTAGRVTNIKPTAPNHLIIIGYVVSAHITQGSIFVKVDNGYELDELHNVAISTPLDNQGLVYETSTDLWKNKTIIEDSITNGVTSIAPSQNAVFDALALKQNALSFTPFKFVQTSQTAHTGTVAETIIATATINGGTFNSSDAMKIFFKVTKPTNSSVVIRLKINTTNTLVGATQIAVYNFTTLANTYVFGNRNYDLQGGNLFGYNFNSSLVSDTFNTNTVGNSTAYNTANTLYLFFTLQLSNIVDSAIPNLCNITN